MTDDAHAPVSPERAGLAGHCPRCGKGKLFRGFIAPAAGCTACGLDYGFADAGDGPAVFVSFAVGLIVVGAALVLDMVCEPPIWVHLVVSLPLVLVLCLGLLRPLKGLLIGLHYRHRLERAEAKP